MFVILIMYIHTTINLNSHAHPRKHWHSSSRPPAGGVGAGLSSCFFLLHPTQLSLKPQSLSFILHLSFMQPPSSTKAPCRGGGGHGRRLRRCLTLRFARVLIRCYFCPTVVIVRPAARCIIHSPPHREGGLALTTLICHRRSLDTKRGCHDGGFRVCGLFCDRIVAEGRIQ